MGLYTSELKLVYVKSYLDGIMVEPQGLLLQEMLLQKRPISNSYPTVFWQMYQPSMFLIKQSFGVSTSAASVA